jgi:8-oxo-dGTP diphosphatase
MYKPQVRVWLNKKDNFVVSEGRVKLLKLIDQTASLREAAKLMKMSYRYAWGIVRKINLAAGKKVVISTRGGKDGGTTILTDIGRKIIEEYDIQVNAIQKVVKYGPRPSVAVDGVIFIKNKLVLIRRKNQPYKGKLALPGGFVEYNETTENAVIREIHEELGVRTSIKRLIGAYSDPDRDPRGHVVSLVYILQITEGELKAGDDAAAFELVPLKKLSEIRSDLAFDHDMIVGDILKELSD